MARAYWNGEEMAGDDGAARPKTERGASRKGKRGGGNGERLAERIKYRYDNHTLSRLWSRSGECGAAPSRT